MVQSQAEDVDGYLAELPEERKEALTRLRELCRAELQGFTEVMAYGMPGYERDGNGEIAFASQKQYISFYLLRSDVREAFAEQLASQDMGKGCLRFRRPEKIDFALLRDLLRATAARAGKICWTGWMVAGFAMAGCCRPGAWMKQGGGMALAAVPANTTRILGIVGLDQVFTIHPDAATATA